jgi:hypothetical protein
MKAGDIKLVQGLGKAMINGVTTYFPGDAVKAKLIKPVWREESDVWWVQIKGDRETRIRRICDNQ